MDNLDKNEIPGEPSQSESAVHTAIRLLRSRNETNKRLSDEDIKVLTKSFVQLGEGYIESDSFETGMKAARDYYEKPQSK